MNIEELRLARDFFALRLDANRYEDFYLGYYFLKTNVRQINAALCRYALSQFTQHAWFDTQFLDDLESVIDHLKNQHEDNLYSPLAVSILRSVESTDYPYDMNFLVIKDLVDMVLRAYENSPTIYNEAHLMADIHVFCGVNKYEVFAVFKQIILGGVTA